MKRLLMALLVCACAAAGQEAPKRRAPMPYVVRKSPGKPVAVVDARRDKSLPVTNALERITRMSQVQFEYRPATAAPGACGRALATEARKDAPAVVVVYDGGAGDPRLEAYPEDRMAVVNAALLRGTPREREEERLGREMFRAATYALGGVDTGLHDVMKPVFSNVELDMLDCDTFSPPVAMGLEKTARLLGVGRCQFIPYRRACMEGWAEPPKTEIEKKIWEQCEQRKTRMKEQKK